MGHELNACLLQRLHNQLHVLGNLSSWRTLWADLCQILESGEDPQGLHLLPYHLSLLDDGDDLSFDSGHCHGPKLEVTGWKQWPLPMILLLLMEPYQHGYDILNMIIFSYALELMSPGWLHHILGLILNSLLTTA